MRRRWEGVTHFHNILTGRQPLLNTGIVAQLSQKWPRTKKIPVRYLCPSAKARMGDLGNEAEFWAVGFLFTFRKTA